MDTRHQSGDTTFLSVEPVKLLTQENGEESSAERIGAKLAIDHPQERVAGAESPHEQAEGEESSAVVLHCTDKNAGVFLSGSELGKGLEDVAKQHGLRRHHEAVYDGHAKGKDKDNHFSRPGAEG